MVAYRRKMAYPKDYFSVNLKVLKIASLWYFTSENWKYKLFCLLNFIYCVIYNTPAEFLSLYQTWGDLSAFIGNLGIALTHFIASWKVINWFFKRKTILKLMETLQDERFYYNVLDGFNPEQIIEEAKSRNNTLTKMFFILANIIPLTSYIVGFVALGFWPESFYSVDEKGITTYCQKLPFYSWIPFQHSSRKSCILATLFQFWPFTYLTIMIVAMDTLFMGLMNFITAHLSVLQEAFRNIRNLALNDMGVKNEEITYYDQKNLEKVMMRYMKKCVVHFQTIQRMCGTMEEIYSLQTLGQVLVSLFVICTCLFLISTVPIGSTAFIVQVFYITAIEYQLTLYCWFGNELTLAGLGIPNAIYEGNWLAASERFKKSMLITMQRLERPLVLTIGKFTPLTLNTFVTILRGSYSLYAVLKNRNTSE